VARFPYIAGDVLDGAAEILAAVTRSAERTGVWRAILSSHIVRRCHGMELSIARIAACRDAR
jgi:hypothetical protein